VVKAKEETADMEEVIRRMKSKVDMATPPRSRETLSLVEGLK
jgi:hypothetical protein